MAFERRLPLSGFSSLSFSFALFSFLGRNLFVVVGFLSGGFFLREIELDLEIEMFFREKRREQNGKMRVKGQS